MQVETVVWNGSWACGTDNARRITRLLWGLPVALVFAASAFTSLLAITILPSVYGILDGINLSSVTDMSKIRQRCQL
jgi:hypothetical protein